MKRPRKKHPQGAKRHDPRYARRFGAILRLHRNAAGLTQMDLAKTLGFIDRTVSYWETGRAEPSLQILIRLADIFDVSLDDLVGRKCRGQYASASTERPA